MTKTFLTLILLSLVAVSCAVSKTRLSDDGKTVKILSKAEKTSCNVVDKVVGVNEKGSDELAQNHARNLAAKVDGNAIFFDEMLSTGKMVKAMATVYECKK